MRNTASGNWEPLKMLEVLQEGIDTEFGKDMYALVYLKWITNKDIL